MANSDYTERGSGLITPTAVLARAYDPAASELSITGYTADNSLVLPAVGSPVMINGEVMKLTAVAADQITVARGCGDTIPRYLLGGSKVWFFDADMRVGTDGREYGSSGTVGVKVLMRTTGTQMGLKNSPPNALTFNHRFIRPYPPGQVKVNGQPFFNTAQFLHDTEPNLVLTWAHRNRITQADQLIDHSMASVAPETGQQYRVAIRLRSDGSLVRLSPAITGTTWTYTLAMATSDLGGGSVDLYAELYSERDSYTSFDKYRIDFRAVLAPLSGFGLNFGNNFGG